jgi:hypothetical protein
MKNDNWQDDWQKGDWRKSDAHLSILWMRERPEIIKKIMRKFPPSCLVLVKPRLDCPTSDMVAIVTSYFEPTEEYPDGMITVRSSPYGNIRLQCRLDWLTVVGYYKGLTTEVIEEILK